MDASMSDEWQPIRWVTANQRAEGITGVASDATATWALLSLTRRVSKIYFCNNDSSFTHFFKKTKDKEKNEYMYL